MKNRIFIQDFTLCLMLIFVIPISADTNPPLISGEWVYFALNKLETNGLTGPIFSNSKPFEREEIAGILANIKKSIKNGSIKPDSHELGLIRKLEAEFTDWKGKNEFKARGLMAGEMGSPKKSSLSFWGAVSFQPSSSVTLYEEVDVGRGRKTVGQEDKTASMRVNPWKWDYTADFQRAYICFHQGRFEALLGRQPIFWGPGYGGSLIISDNSPAFDMILLKAKFGAVKAIAFSAMLDKMWNDRVGQTRYLANRYMSGHRLDWLVNSRIELGISEVILYGGEARNMEIQYVNSLLPYYANQYNSKLDDNSLVSVDFSIKPVNKLKLYGQFLVDDFSYDDLLHRKGHDPNALGYLAGFYVSGPINSTDLRAEYTRIDTWTYTHLVPEKRYTHYGWLIGHSLGPDADQLLMELSHNINIDARLKLSYAFKREGGRTVLDRYRGEDYKSIKFPSPPVERQHTIGLQFLWEPARGPQINISLQRSFIHKSGDSSQESELNFKAGYLLFD